MGRARRKIPAHTRAAGANRYRLRQATAPPVGDGPANQKGWLAGGANQKLQECASRGKRAEPERAARWRGRGRVPRPDRLGTRPMAGLRGRPGARGLRDPREWPAL